MSLAAPLIAKAVELNERLRKGLINLVSINLRGIVDNGVEIGLTVFPRSISLSYPKVLHRKLINNIHLLIKGREQCFDISNKTPSLYAYSPTIYHHCSKQKPLRKNLDTGRTKASCSHPDQKDTKAHPYYPKYHT
jgi:hypothetical protein